MHFKPLRLFAGLNFLVALVAMVWAALPVNAWSADSSQYTAQEIVDAFFLDIDYSIRELGVGDTGVPKRMKKLAGMFYGRLESYAKALDTGDREALAAALARNIHPQAGEIAQPMRRLADWAFAAEAALAVVDEADIAVGSLQVPSPAEEES